MSIQESIPVPEISEDGPILLFTPTRVEEMRRKRDKYVWARHGYYDALLTAERIYKDTFVDETYGHVPAMSFTDNGRCRQNFRAAFCAAMIGHMDNDESYLRRAFEILEHAIDEGATSWWQPASQFVTFAADGLWPVLSTNEKKGLQERIKHALSVCSNQTNGGNQAAGTCKAMIGTGIITRDRELIHHAIHREPMGIIELIHEFICEEGYWDETAPGYHTYAIKQIVETAYLCEMIGVPLLDTYRETIRKACRVIFQVIDHQYGLPAIGDTHKNSCLANELPQLEIATALFKDPWCCWALKRSSRSGFESLAYGTPDLSSAEEPSPESSILDDTGLAILRSTSSENYWEDEGAKTAYLRYGRHGGWHGHDDSLQLELRAHGREMVTARRRASAYANRSHYSWHRTTLAHSTVVVDKTNQLRGNVPGGERLHFLNETGINALTVANPHVYPGFTYERSLVQTPDVLIDFFRVAGKGEHLYHYVLHGEGTYRSSAHLEPIDSLGCGDGFRMLTDIKSSNIGTYWDATLEQGSWNSNRWQPFGTGMKVSSLHPLSGRLIVASCMDGGTHAFEDCVIIESQGSEKLFFNLLEPFNGETKVRSKHSELIDQGYYVELKYDEHEDLIFYQPHNETQLDTERLSYQGQFLYLRIKGGQVIKSVADKKETLVLK